MPPNPGCGTGAEDYLYTNAEMCFDSVSEANSSLLFDLIQDKDPNVVFAAVSSLRGEVNRKRLQPVFRRFLMDRRPEWRAIGINGLYHSGLNADFFRRILPLLGDPDERIRQSAQYYFSFMQNNITGAEPEEINTLLVETYETGTPVMRASVLHIYGDARIYLRPFALNDSDGYVRAQAIHEFLKFDTMKPYLLQQFTHPDPRVRREAGKAWWNQNFWNQKEALPLDLMLSLLNDPDAEVRETQIANVAEYTDARITQPLLQALRHSEDKDGWLSQHVSAYLVKQGADAIPLVRQLLHADNPNLRMAAVGSVGKLLPQEAAGLLLTALKDETPAVRALAVKEFQDAADETIENALFPLLHDKTVQVRLAAVRKLGAIGSEQAREQLISLPEDADDEVDEAIVEEIQRLNKTLEPTQTLMLLYR